MCMVAARSRLLYSLSCSTVSCSSRNIYIVFGILIHPPVTVSILHNVQRQITVTQSYRQCTQGIRGSDWRPPRIPYIYIYIYIESMCACIAIVCSICDSPLAVIGAVIIGQCAVLNQSIDRSIS